MRRNTSRNGSGWQIECSQLSLKRNSPRQIETACLRGKRFFRNSVYFGSGKTFSEYSLCDFLKHLHA
jgi:hypothetical protein